MPATSGANVLGSALPSTSCPVLSPLTAVLRQCGPAVEQAGESTEHLRLTPDVPRDGGPSAPSALPITTLLPPEQHTRHGHGYWQSCAGRRCDCCRQRGTAQGAAATQTAPAYTDSKARRTSQFSRLTFACCQPLNFTQPTLHPSSEYVASLLHTGAWPGFEKSRRDAEYSTSLCIFSHN